MHKFPITAAFEAGVPVDLIPSCLEQGDNWAISDATEAASMLEVRLSNPSTGGIRGRVARWIGVGL